MLIFNFKHINVKYFKKFDECRLAHETFARNFYTN